MAIFTQAYALAGSSLVSFNPTNPTAGISAAVVTGLVAGQTLVGIDFRPADGRLYGFGVDAGTETATLYSISLQTGAATIVGSASFVTSGVDLPASGYGFDFNWTVDRIRVTTDSGLNFRINPNNGQIAGIDTMTPGGITGAAYTDNEPNINIGGITTLYTLDSNSDRLMIQNPPNQGIQIPVGFVGVDFSSVNGFDIPTGVEALVAGSGVPSGSGLALLTVGGTTQLYSINLVSGAGTLVGNFLNGATPASGLAIQERPVDDFNGDGKGDLLFQHPDGSAAIWFLDGHTRLAGQNVGTINPGPTWDQIGSADFNNDGKNDILWQNDNGLAAIWFMNGFNVVSEGLVNHTNVGPTWHVIAGADFNADGNADILWQNDNGAAAIWLMNGFNVIGEGQVGTINPGPTWNVIDAGDFNGDGNADILWQNDNGTAALWLMDGLNVLSEGPVNHTNVGPSWNIQAAGDFNGDGRADILWQNDNGAPALWLMNGHNVVAENFVGFNPGPTWQVHDANDVNGDGKADIVWQSTQNGQPATWLMDGLAVLSGSNVGPAVGGWEIQPPHHDLLV